MIEFLMATALNLQGAWFKPCEETPDHVFIHEELQISGDQWVRTTFGNRAIDCSGINDLKVRQVFKASIHDFDLDMTPVSTTYESLTDDETEMWNAIAFCGFENWKTNAPKDVSGLKCEDSEIPRKGETQYSTLRLQAFQPRDLLWVGESTSNADGSSPEERHLIFEVFAFERKNPPLK